MKAECVRCFGVFQYSLTQGTPSRSLVHSSCYTLYIACRVVKAECVRCFGVFRYSLTQGTPSRSLVHSSCHTLYIACRVVKAECVRCFGVFRYSLTQGTPSRSLVHSSCYTLYIACRVVKAECVNAIKQHKPRIFRPSEVIFCLQSVLAAPRINALQSLKTSGNIFTQQYSVTS